MNTLDDAPQTRSNFAAMTILIVEDDKGVVEMTKRLLKNSGMPIAEIITTDSLHEGLELAHTCNPDVIVLDLSLKDAGAELVVEAIPEMSERAAVVVMSGKIPDEWMARVHANGALAFLPKMQFLRVGFEGFFYHALVTAKLTWNHYHQHART